MRMRAHAVLAAGAIVLIAGILKVGGVFISAEKCLLTEFGGGYSSCSSGSCKDVKEAPAKVYGRCCAGSCPEASSYCSSIRVMDDCGCWQCKDGIQGQKCRYKQIELNCDKASNFICKSNYQAPEFGFCCPNVCAEPSCISSDGRRLKDNCGCEICQDAIKGGTCHTSYYRQPKGLICRTNVYCEKNGPSKVQCKDLTCPGGMDTVKDNCGDCSCQPTSNHIGLPCALGSRTFFNCKKGLVCQQPLLPPEDGSDRLSHCCPPTCTEDSDRCHDQGCLKEGTKQVVDICGCCWCAAKPSRRVGRGHRSRLEARPEARRKGSDRSGRQDKNPTSRRGSRGSSGEKLSSPPQHGSEGVHAHGPRQDLRQGRGRGEPSGDKSGASAYGEPGTSSNRKWIPGTEGHWEYET